MFASADGVMNTQRKKEGRNGSFYRCVNENEFKGSGFPDKNLIRTAVKIPSLRVTNPLYGFRGIKNCPEVLSADGDGALSDGPALNAITFTEIVK